MSSEAQKLGCCDWRWHCTITSCILVMDALVSTCLMTVCLQDNCPSLHFLCLVPCPCAKGIVAKQFLPLFLQPSAPHMKRSGQF